MHLELFIIVFVISCFLLYLYFKISNPDMTYIKSDIDNDFYLVRNVSDSKEASNTLARMKQNLHNLTEHLHKNINADENKEYVEYIERLHNKINSIVILESTQDSIYTSYSKGKGEQIVFCVRSRKNNDIHDINIMMYVALHEISHVACPIYDNHGPLFKKIFAFITNTAIKLNMYVKSDYKTSPVEYCGLQITESII